MMPLHGTRKGGDIVRGVLKLPGFIRNACGRRKATRPAHHPSHPLHNKVGV